MNERMIEQLFTCRVCKEDKPREQMGANIRLKNGTARECKACRSIMRYSNGDYVKEQLRKYGYRKEGGGPVHISDEEIQSIKRKTTCGYCGIELTFKNNEITEQTVDHVYPLNDTFSGYGGVNIAGNLAICCRSCNAAKGSEHIYDFYQRSERFTDELWTEFVQEYIGRMIGRPLTDADVIEMTGNFADEAIELRKLVETI